MSITDPNIDEWGIFRCLPIKYLDYTDNWMLQQTYSLNLFPLTMTIFERYPTMVKAAELPKYFMGTQFAEGIKYSGYGGIDGVILGNLASLMNFTVKIIQPQDKRMYGYKIDGTNNYTGTLGDLLYDRADIAFNLRFLVSYDTDDIEYMVPILGDKVCVIAPAAEKIPQWKAIFQCFDIYFWCIFVIITSFTSVVYSVLKFYQEKQEMRMIRDSFLYKDFKNMVVEEKIVMKSIFPIIWRVMLGVTSKLPSGTVERILIGSCLVANIIIAGSFDVRNFLTIFNSLF